MMDLYDENVTEIDNRDPGTTTIGYKNGTKQDVSPTFCLDLVENALDNAVDPERETDYIRYKNAVQELRHQLRAEGQSE